MPATRPLPMRTGAVVPPSAPSASLAPPPSRSTTLRWLNRRLATASRPGGGPPLPPVPSVEACRDGVAVATILHALSPAHLPAGAVSIPAATAAAREANWAAVADALRGLGVERVLEVDRLVAGGYADLLCTLQWLHAWWGGVAARGGVAAADPRGGRAPAGGGGPSISRPRPRPPRSPSAAGIPRRLSTSSPASPVPRRPAAAATPPSGVPASAPGAAGDGSDALGAVAAAAAPTAADLSACLAAAVEAERRAAALAAELAEEVAARRVAAAQADHFGRRVDALRAVLAATGGEARAGRLFAAVAAAIGADDEGGVESDADADAPVAVSPFEPAAKALAASGAPTSV